MPNHDFEIVSISLGGNDMTLSDTITSNKTLFDSLIRDIADRFGLGPSAAPLMQEVLNMITNSSGGIGGFLNTLKSNGLGSEIASWLGNPNATPLPVQELNRVVSPTVLGNIGSRVGLGTSAVSTAVAYALPKLIGVLTPGGKIPAQVSSEIQSPPIAPRVSESFGRGTAPRARYVEQVAPRHIEVIHDEPHMMRWLWPLLGALAILGIGSYLFSNSNRVPTTPVAVQTPAVPAAPAAPTLPARLALSNDDGAIHYSGSVHDDETRTSIINSLKAVFGADKIQGGIGIDLNRGAAPWLVNFRTALGNLKDPGLQAVFDGNSINVGGVISDADRDRISNSLRSVLGSGLVVGALADRVADLVSSTNSKVVAALSSLQTGFDAKDLVGVLNQSIINFPSGGSDVPTATTPLMQKAAAQIKELKPGTVLEIAGYTDNTGDAAANMTLSQQRADAVRNELIKDGVDPAMLVAKGYGSTSPIASNDLLEGRFRNRRIEYHVLKT
jgi:OmpA-OmpF porin, OOP family